MVKIAQQQDDRQAQLEAILPHLDAGGSTKWPDKDDEYWALCPFHDDAKPHNFSVSIRGYKCFVCDAHGSLRKLAEHLGIASVAVLQCSPRDRDKNTFTLDVYAKAKRLEVDFLKSLGVSESTYRGRTRVLMPYYGTDGEELARRYRQALSGDNRFRWASGSKVHPYGLWKLAQMRETHDYVIVVEGESDTQTLWSYGLPALGIPGASTFKQEWAAYLDGLTVYVWREPDEGGQTFVQKVGEALPEARVLVPPEGRKDISEAHVLGEDVPALLEELRAKARAWEEIQAEAQQEQADEARDVAGELLTCPDILGEFEHVLWALGLVGEAQNAKLLYLALTSRLLEQPVSVVVKGVSSSGKSFTIDTVLQTMPPSAYLDFTSMSERALIYDDRPISHKMIVLYEASGLGMDREGEPATLAYCVRSLLSEGRIKYTTIERTDDGLTARHILREGPTGLITTTTWAGLHPENETRMLSLTVTDTTEQTRAVLVSLGERMNGRERAPVELAPWHALQTWLELAGCRDVSIPYAHALADKSSAHAVRMRRDFGKVLSLIAAHTMLHQENRKRDDAGRVVATLDDYRTVYDLVREPIGEGIEATVSDTVKETVETVARLLEEQGEPAAQKPITLAALAEALDLDKSSVSRRVRVARRLGYLVNEEERRGRPAQIVTGEPLPEEEPALPTPEELSSATVANTRGKALNSLGEEGAKECFSLYPSAHTATLQHSDDLAATCCVCGAPVECYGPKGEPYCEEHRQHKGEGQ